MIPGGKVVQTGKNAARERSRVKDLRTGFSSLQSLIPNVPPDTKLSKLDILILATNYIKFLSDILDEDGDSVSAEETDARAQKESPAVPKYLHPVKVSTGY